jgi:hypothetical protein
MNKLSDKFSKGIKARVPMAQLAQKTRTASSSPNQLKPKPFINSFSKLVQ